MPSPNWFNTNANRSYPFVDRTVDRPGSGEVRNLPDSAIVDAGFVMGTGAGFDAALHAVRLARVRRLPFEIEFEFESTAPAMFGSKLVFRRDITEPGYVTEDADSDASYGLSLSDPDEVCLEPLWSGFLVTGPVDALLEMLADSDWELTGGAGQGAVEPALIQNLSGEYVSSLNLANDDRTRVDSPDGCDVTSWPEPPEPLYLNAACLRGAVSFSPGYNALIEQADTDNTLTFRAEVGAGAGQPCNEVPLYPGEAPAAGTPLLSGGPACGQVLRSINGVGGRLFDVLVGLGFQLTALPDENKVVVDCNFSGLALCPEDVSSVSESV